VAHALFNSLHTTTLKNTLTLRNKKIADMKTIITTLAALTILTASIFAQATDNEIITISANLNTTMALDVATEGITFDFNTLEEYENGMGGKNGSYSTEVGISSTSNWEFGYKAATDFVHTDGTTTMPLDNLGVTITWTGTNNAKNYCNNNPLALENQEVRLLGQQGNQSNAGDEEANSFIIYWEMGTTDGNMNNESLFEQDLKKGSYSVDVEFIITEVI
jgi:hypothetical protein